MRMKNVCLAGAAAAMLVSGAAQAALDLANPISIVAKSYPGAPPRLLICNLFVNFTAPGDRLFAVVGLPAGQGAQLVYSTNVTNGFFQVPDFFGGFSDFAQTSQFLGLTPALEWDTYIDIGYKTGTDADNTNPQDGYDNADPYETVTVDINFGWNGGKVLDTGLANGGSYFLLNSAATSQHIAVNGQVFIGQLVIDTNRDTNDGLLGSIDVAIPQLVWGNAAGMNFTDVINFEANHIPAPGTLALLGLAGLAGIRRRRRA